MTAVPDHLQQEILGAVRRPAGLKRTALSSLSNSRELCARCERKACCSV